MNAPVPDRLAEIEARLAAVLPRTGPWRHVETRSDGGRTREHAVETDDRVIAWGLYGPTAELIAHAPADLAALVAVVKAVREIHRPIHMSDGRQICAICPTVTPNGALVPTLYPCPTARALEAM